LDSGAKVTERKDWKVLLPLGEGKYQKRHKRGKNIHKRSADLKRGVAPTSNREREKKKVGRGKIETGVKDGRGYTPREKKGGRKRGEGGKKGSDLSSTKRVPHGRRSKR